MQSKKNWAWILVGVVLISFFSLGLLLLVFSGQFRNNSKQFVAQTINQISFLPETKWSQSGEEKIIPVVIINEHPQMEITQSDFVSFDFVTDRFQDYFFRSQIEKVVIHFTDQPQFINQSVSIDEPAKQLAGFGGDEIDNQAHIYLFADRENLLESNLSIDKIVERLEWNLTGGLVFLRYATIHHSYPVEELWEETQVEQELIDASKDYQPLFGLSLE